MCRHSLSIDHYATNTHMHAHRHSSVIRRGCCSSLVFPEDRPVLFIRYQHENRGESWSCLASVCLRPPTWCPVSCSTSCLSSAVSLCTWPGWRNNVNELMLSVKSIHVKMKCKSFVFVAVASTQKESTICRCESDASEWLHQWLNQSPQNVNALTTCERCVYGTAVAVPAITADIYTWLCVWKTQLQIYFRVIRHLVEDSLKSYCLHFTVILIGRPVNENLTECFVIDIDKSGKQYTV